MIQNLNTTQILTKGKTLFKENLLKFINLIAIIMVNVSPLGAIFHQIILIMFSNSYFVICLLCQPIHRWYYLYFIPLNTIIERKKYI